jgi:hypothetical protein
MARVIRVAAGVTLAALMASVPCALADKKEKPAKGKKSGSVEVSFTKEQRDAAQGWYVQTYGHGNCPPGLAKKNNGCLPPGHAKKRYQVGHPLPAGTHYEPIPSELSVRIGKPPAGYVYVTLDGDLVQLAVGTLLVVDAIDGLLH